MKNLQQSLTKREATDTQVLDMSMDSLCANKAFADSVGVTFPLLSDWGGTVAGKYGRGVRFDFVGGAPCDVSWPCFSSASSAVVEVASEGRSDPATPSSASRGLLASSSSRLSRTP